ncbi:MAG: ABC transporter substrate-binding protein [Candidatus Taylorbacteria bacterium]|nr:ABC transporter substrate-binding protein [Candidatus Taylorbacteria bacterium]
MNTEENKGGMGKWIAGVLIIVVVILIITFSKSGSNTIKIGALYPLTGGLVTYGEPAQKSAKMAVDEINNAGGINGQKLEINYQDHKCDPKTAVAAFQQLNSADGIKVFTSAACTGTAAGIAPTLKNNNAVFVSDVLSGAKITGISPFIFRNWASDLNESRLFALKIKEAGYKKVAVIYEETDYAKGIKINLENFLKDSGVNVVAESFATGVTDVRTQLTKLKVEKADVLLISPQTVTSAEVVLKQMEDINFRTKLLLNDNVIISKDLILKHKDILEGALGANFVAGSSTKTAEVLKKYKDTYGQDCPQTTVCVYTYDTIHLLADAIKVNGYDVEKIKNYLNSNSYEGIAGTISFDEKNDRKNADYTLFLVENGVAKAVEK